MDYLNGWTKEKVITKVKKEFKGYSYSDNMDMCAYRGDDGKKCIAGCFISDKLYDSMPMEDTSIGSLMEEPSIRDCMPFDSATMGRWQGVHDCLDIDLGTVEEQKEILLEFLG